MIRGACCQVAAGCVLLSSNAVGQDLGFPGGWTGNADWVADGALMLNWAIGESNYPGNAKSATLTATVNGPGDLAFDWNCAAPVFPAPPFAAAWLRVQTGATQREVTAGGSSATSPQSIPLAAGANTVTFTLYGDPGATLPTSYSLSGLVRNVRVIPPLTLAGALDTNLTVTGNAWYPVTGTAGDYVRLPVGAYGTLQTTVTGPAVISIAGNVGYEGTGPSGGFDEFAVRYFGPGADASGTLLSRYFLPMEWEPAWGFVIPAGTHALSWTANSGYTTYGDGIYWKLDNLQVHQLSDYAAALENDFSWNASGDPGCIPWPQQGTSHDGADAIRFPKSLSGGLGTGRLSTSVEGPLLLSFWWKDPTAPAGTRVLLDGSPLPVIAPSSTWSRVWMRIPAGVHTVEWASASTNMYAEYDAWLDEVRPAAPFETWLAGFLTDSQLAAAGSMNPDSDADADGRPALMEYALQTSPLVASRDREPALGVDAAVPGSRYLTWRESGAVSGVTFAAEVSSDLLSWEVIPKSEAAADGMDKIMRAYFSDGAGRKWARLRVTQK